MLVLVSGVGAAPGGQAGRFVSKQYGYVLVLPTGWRGVAATTTFPGGDIDHTESYVDSFSAPDERLMFALGQRTKGSVATFSRQHGRWLAANRPCRALGTWRASTLSGTPARVASFACDGGVYGSTFVAKWVVVRRGLGLVFTQFSPDGQRAKDRSVITGLLRGLSWRS